MIKNKLIAILLSGIMLLSFTGCDKEKKQYIESPDQRPDIKENSSKNEAETKPDDKDSTKPEVKPTNPEESKSENKNEEPKPENKSPKPSEEYSKNDIMVINSFSTLKSNVDTELKSSKVEDAKSKVTGAFITIVDFIFYDSEINGIKFDDLSDAAKQNVLDTATQIDELIMKKFPNYKEDISSTTSKAFTKASELIKKGANNIKNFSKDLLGEDNYNAIIDAKDDLVKYTKNAFHIIGNFAGNLFENGKDKLKDWYENFKNKNEG